MCSRSTYQNPYVNLAFGSANKGMGSAGSIAAAEARRVLAARQAESARMVNDFWSGNGAAIATLPAAQEPLPPLHAVPPAVPKSRPLTRRQSRANLPFMKVMVGFEAGLQRGQSQITHVESALREALARFGERVTRVEAHLADADGQARSQPGAIHCTLQASLVGLEPEVASAEADNVHQAVQLALDRLKRAVGSALAKHDPRRQAARSGERQGSEHAAA